MVRLLRVALGEEDSAGTGQRMLRAADCYGAMTKEKNIHLLPWMTHRG